MNKGKRQSEKYTQRTKEVGPERGSEKKTEIPSNHFMSSLIQVQRPQITTTFTIMSLILFQLFNKALPSLFFFLHSSVTV